jgi:hypothetical protein
MEMVPVKNRTGIMTLRMYRRTIHSQKSNRRSSHSSLSADYFSMTAKTRTIGLATALEGKVG